MGSIAIADQFNSTIEQNKSWECQIPILKQSLNGYKGIIFFEFSIPRMGKRVDTLLIIDNIVFVIEFKVGEKKFHQYHIDQVWDYALDLKNFHKPSHHAVLVPILTATEAEQSFIAIQTTSHDDDLIHPIRTSKADLGVVIKNTLGVFS